MTELLLSLQDSNEGSFEKIAPSIYYKAQNSSFYRLSFLPHTVIFQNEQISQPQFATYTKYDPYFYLINLLIRKNIPKGEIPPRFKHLNINRLADIKVDGGQDVYVLSNYKVYDYLETKVRRLEKCISEQLGEKSLEVDKSIIEEKVIREETVAILKSEIDDKQFVDAFAKDRYNYENIRKLMPYSDEPEETIAKKKAPPKKEAKKQEKRLEQGQKTLFGFFGGKK